MSRIVLQEQNNLLADACREAMQHELPSLDDEYVLQTMPNLVRGSFQSNIKQAPNLLWR